jgi:putative tryptophan/tyrosine transport system substrate-binding protein
MKRREFITLLGSAAAWPLAARAQQSAKQHRIGMLETISPELNVAHLDAFRDGLRQLGYSEGQSYTIEYRSADGRADRFPDLAAELVRLGVDLIVARGTPAAIAAKNATETIPVVMASVGDPLLVVDSLARRSQRDGAERLRQRDDHKTSRTHGRVSPVDIAHSAVCQHG